MRQVAVILTTLVLLACGAAVAVAGHGGSTDHGNAGYSMYRHKPGCGPKGGYYREPASYSTSCPGHSHHHHHHGY